MNNLQQIIDLRSQIAQLQSQLNEATKNLELHVSEYGPVQDFGLVAHFRPGRKKTDHRQAAIDAKVDPLVIEKHSETKTTVSWAKVTKACKIDVSAYTTIGDPSFVIEEFKYK